MAAASAPSSVDIDSRRRRSASGLRVLAFAEGLHGPEAMALDDRTEALSAALHLSKDRPSKFRSAWISWGLPLFERLQIGDQVFDLIRIEAKDRHRRVSDQNAFTKGFCKIFHIIAQMQLAKRRRHLKWTRADGSDRMALCAPFLCQPLSQSRVAAFGADGHGKEEH